MTVVEGVLWEVIDLKFRLVGVGRGKDFFLGVVNSSILFEELGFSIAGVVWMGEAIVDEEGFAFVFLGAVFEVVEDLVCVP